MGPRRLRLQASVEIKCVSLRAGRASQAQPVRHWDCGYSDVTLGYAFASSNRSVSLVSVREAMRDATYGAMKGEHFVVAHHLRNERTN